MKAFLYAYDKVNLGDDLFVEALVRRYPDVQFYMWSEPENRMVFSNLPNLHIWNPDGRFPSFLGRLRPSLQARWLAVPKDRSDCCIYIGGSIFQEYDSWSNIVNWWQYHSQRYPFFVLGANFGPWRTEAYRDAMASVFRNLQDICFRDRYSHRLFEDCPRARVAPDILFGQRFPETAPKKQILLSVIDCKDGPNGLSDVAERYEACLLDMAADYARHGYEVKLVSFCKAEGDERACLRLQGALRDRGAECSTLFYTGQNRAELLEEIAASAFIVGTRFHACVLGLAAGKKVLPVIYSDKTKNMLLDIGFPGPVLDLREPFAPMLCDELETCAASLNPAPLAQKADGHFMELDRFFSSRKSERG